MRKLLFVIVTSAAMSTAFAKDCRVLIVPDESTDSCLEAETTDVIQATLQEKGYLVVTAEKSPNLQLDISAAVSVNEDNRPGPSMKEAYGQVWLKTIRGAWVASKSWGTPIFPSKAKANRIAKGLAGKLPSCAEIQDRF